MNRKRITRLAIALAGAAATLLASSLPALAQCAMCKNAITGSPEAERLSQSLNFAIIVLLIPPVLIFCGIFFLAYRYRKSRETELGLSDDDPKGGAGRTNPAARKKSRSERETGGALA